MSVIRVTIFSAGGPLDVDVTADSAGISNQVLEVCQGGKVAAAFFNWSHYVVLPDASDVPQT
jgi:hypothetical protein